MINRTDATALSSVRNASIKAATQISMLGESALALLYGLSSQTEGPILELGPYIGGSTIALAANASAQVVTVEIGGPNEGHEITTSDIISDLKANIEKAGAADRVKVIDGHFRAHSTFERARAALNHKKVGLVFIDIHPGTELALRLYADVIADGAYIVIDDYESEIAFEKSSALQRFVDAAVAAGVMIPIGVFGWGTWFGRLAGSSDALRAFDAPTPLPVVHESGFAWQTFVGHVEFCDDRTSDGSPLILFEDEAPIGPAHSLHDDIRRQGGGRFSHWDGNLWFSTSDNSDPRSNGRKYEFDINGVRYSLNDHVDLP